MAKPGRPPLDPDSRSKSVHVKLGSSDYDCAYTLAKAEGISVPELLRTVIEIEQGDGINVWEAFRAIRTRRNAERAALLAQQIANMKVGPARRRRRFRDGFVEEVQRHVVYSRHGGICGICKQAVDSSRFHVDHIIPLARGGQHSYANTQPAHQRCNSKKHARIGFVMEDGSV